MSKNNVSEESKTSTIAMGVEIVGEIKANGNIRIDGTVKGNISLTGKLVVVNTGIIEGDREEVDIFLESSKTIIGILKEYGKVPGYAHILRHADYFGGRVVGKNAIRKLVQAWETEPQQFTVDTKKNLLTYTYESCTSSRLCFKHVSDTLS